MASARAVPCLIRDEMLKQPLNKIDFAVVDIETTGYSHNYHTIVEVGAVKLKNGKAIDSYESLIYTDYIPYRVVQIHGIDTDMVRDAPRMTMVKKEFCDFIKGCVLVGHNIKRFDMHFLCKYFNMSDSLHCVDTIDLSRRLFPRERLHNLKIVAERTGVEYVGCHRALKDAQITAQVFLKALKLGNDKFKVLEDLI